jgi:hypothetical protein
MAIRKFYPPPIGTTHLSGIPIPIPWNRLLTENVIVTQIAKMDRKEIGSEGVDWINVAPNRDRWQALVNTVMNLQVPRNEGNFFTS